MKVLKMLVGTGFMINLHKCKLLTDKANILGLELMLEALALGLKSWEISSKWLYPQTSRNCRELWES